MDRAAILAKAAECVTGRRETDHGRPEDTFRRIADLWEAYTGHHYTSIDVAMMMTLLKVARTKGAGCLDNFIDIAGYAACAGEIYDKATKMMEVEIE